MSHVQCHCCISLQEHWKNKWCNWANLNVFTYIKKKLKKTSQVAVRCGHYPPRRLCVLCFLCKAPGLCVPSQQVGICPASVISVVIVGSRCSLWHLWGGSSAFVFNAQRGTGGSAATVALLHPISCMEYAWVYYSPAPPTGVTAPVKDTHHAQRRLEQLACTEAKVVFLYFHMKETWTKFNIRVGD